MINRLAHLPLNTAKCVRNIVANLIEHPVIVLTYHRVADLSNDPQLLAVSPKQFHEQICYLKKHYEIVHFKDNWFPRKKTGVAITFDDGYADNLHAALPILEEEKVPATFFITTGGIGTEQEFWWDDLERILLANNKLPEKCQLSWETKGKERCFNFQETSGRQLYNRLHPFTKKLPGRERQSFLTSLAEWAGVCPHQGRDSHRIITLGELHALNNSSMTTMGAHTLNHVQLSQLTEHEQRIEINGAKSQLEKWLGEEVMLFSYPFGGHFDFNKTSMRLCKEAGFTKVAANYSGQAHRFTNSYAIPRQLVRNWGIDQFAANMKRFHFL